MAYDFSQNDHWKKGFAAAVYHSIVSQATRQVREDFSGSFLAVVVCAGWHAEVDAMTSMKEAFCAKQLAMCRTTMDLMRWAKLNSDVPMHFDISLSSAPTGAVPFKCAVCTETALANVWRIFTQCRM